jgi:hypothetical protein
MRVGRAAGNNMRFTGGAGAERGHWRSAKVGGLWICEFGFWTGEPPYITGCQLTVWGDTFGETVLWTRSKSRARFTP